MLKNLKMHKNFWEQTIEKIRTSPHIFIIHCAVAVCSFILSCSTVFGGISPFGIAIITAIPADFMYTAFLGVTVGYIASQPIIMVIRYIILIVSLKVFFSKMTYSKSNYSEVWFLPPAIVFSFTFLSGLIATAFQSLSLTSFTLVLSESLVSAVSVYFFSRVFEIKDINKGFGNMQTRDLVCVLFCLGVMILTLSSFKIAEISVANILSGFLILSVSFFGNEGAGTTIGVTSGIATGLYTSSLHDTVSLTFSGLLSGVFSPLGKIGCIVSFLLARICVFLISGQKDGFLILISESVFSIFFFSLIPQKLMPEIKRLFNVSVKENVTVQARREMSDKLNKASECINSISESIGKISESLKKVSDSSEKSVYCFVQADVCKSCRKYSTCWDNYFSQTYKFFEATTDIFRENQRVEKEDLPKKFVNSCIRTDELISSFEKNYRHAKSKREEEQRVTSTRNMLFDQLGCMSKTLSNFSSEILKETHTDLSTAVKIKEILRENGITVSNVNCPVSSSGTMKITALCRHIDSSLDKAFLLGEIEKVTLRKFEKPEIKYLESGIVLELTQKPWMSIEIGTVQYSSDGYSLCGDYSECFYDDGVQTIVISDGMGTGGRAAIDSAMTAEFFGKLIRSGFDEDTALKIVNSSMLVKSTYESLSTIDVAKIDLFTGKINFFKAGAAVSFVRKNGKCHVIEGSALPIGILREISFAKSSISVSPDDVIVMVSDGVTAGGIEKIKEEIEGKYFSSAQSFAQQIALKATGQNGKNPSDDITVVVGLIKK